MDTSVQSLFFEQIRKRLPPHVSFVDELAELLDISRDSAYRRMRGETVLSLDEVKKLAVQFKISVDSIISPSADSAFFQYRAVNKSDFTFKDWLKTIDENLSHATQFSQGGTLVFRKGYSGFLLLQFTVALRFQNVFLDELGPAARRIS